jgi:hypothetical protein
MNPRLGQAEKLRELVEDHSARPGLGARPIEWVGEVDRARWSSDRVKRLNGPFFRPYDTESVASPRNTRARAPFPQRNEQFC